MSSLVDPISSAFQEWRECLLEWTVDLNNKTKALHVKMINVYWLWIPHTTIYSLVTETEKKSWVLSTKYSNVFRHVKMSISGVYHIAEIVTAEALTSTNCNLDTGVSLTYTTIKIRKLYNIIYLKCFQNMFMAISKFTWQPSTKQMKNTQDITVWQPATNPFIFTLLLRVSLAGCCVNRMYSLDLQKH